MLESIENGDNTRFRRSFSLLGDNLQCYKLRCKLVGTCCKYDRWNMLIIIDPTYFERKERSCIWEEKLKSIKYTEPVFYEPIIYNQMSPEERINMVNVPRELLIHQLHF